VSPHDPHRPPCQVERLSLHICVRHALLCDPPMARSRVRLCAVGMTGLHWYISLGDLLTEELGSLGTSSTGLHPSRGTFQVRHSGQGKCLLFLLGWYGLRGFLRLYHAVVLRWGNANPCSDYTDTLYHPICFISGTDHTSNNTHHITLNRSTYDRASPNLFH
jgi:hypothetical protein